MKTVEATRAPHERRPARWLILAGGLLACSAIVVTATRWWDTRQQEAELCRSLAAHVDGISWFRWTNGITESEAAWSSILVNHEHVPQSVRDAVRADEEGFARVLDALPEELRSDAEQVHAALVRPSSSDVPDSTADQAAGALARHVIDTCNVAP